MWNPIQTHQDILRLLVDTEQFHDSCIKEIKYLSGAFVDNSLAMHPINSLRKLSILIQRQSNFLSTIEIEFGGLIYFYLSPVDERFSCEILDGDMCLHNGCIYWGDCGKIFPEETENYPGTLICAESCRWRVVNNGLGNAAFYKTEDGTEP